MECHSIYLKKLRRNEQNDGISYNKANTELPAMLSPELLDKSFCSDLICASDEMSNAASSIHYDSPSAHWTVDAKSVKLDESSNDKHITSLTSAVCADENAARSTATQALNEVAWNTNSVSTRPKRKAALQCMEENEWKLRKSTRNEGNKKIQSATFPHTENADVSNDVEQLETGKTSIFSDSTMLDAPTIVQLDDSKGLGTNENCGEMQLADAYTGEAVEDSLDEEAFNQLLLATPRNMSVLSTISTAPAFPSSFLSNARLTHLRGVFFDKSRRRFCANWYSDGGKKQQRYFPIKCYGYQAARQLALQCRQNATDVATNPRNERACKPMSSTSITSPVMFVMTQENDSSTADAEANLKHREETISSNVNLTEKEWSESISKQEQLLHSSSSKPFSIDDVKSTQERVVEMVSEMKGDQKDYASAYTPEYQRPRGLWYDRHHQRWAAYFQVDSSTRKTKYFPVKTYGYKKAYHLAVVARHTYEKEASRHSSVRSIDLQSVLQKVDSACKGMVASLEAADDYHGNREKDLLGGGSALQTEKRIVQQEVNSIQERLRSDKRSTKNATLLEYPKPIEDTESHAEDKLLDLQKQAILHIFYDLRSNCIYNIASQLKLPSERIRELLDGLTQQISLVELSPESPMLMAYTNIFRVLITGNVLPSNLPVEAQLKWISFILSHTYKCAATQSTKDTAVTSCHATFL